jgi:hypothetical protein
MMESEIVRAILKVLISIYGVIVGYKERRVDYSRGTLSH